MRAKLHEARAAADGMGGAHTGAAAPAARAVGAGKPRIGISGSYGGLNLGDEAILHSIVDSLRREAELVVFSRDPADTEVRHRVQSVDVRGLTRLQSREVVAGLDLLVFGGGGLLFDDEAELFLREVQLAHELGVPVMVYGISAGPLTLPHTRKLVRDALDRCAAITVRDRHGVHLLQEIGIETPLQLTADPALLLRPAKLQASALRHEMNKGARRLIGFSVREPGAAAPDLDIDHYHALVANAADYVIDRFDAEVVFVPMERRHVDIQHSHAVAAKMQHAARTSIVKGEYAPAQLLMLLRRFDLAIGMRLHFLIFAALAGVPFVSLPYASKVSGFIEDLDLPAPPLTALNAGTLLAHIDRSWDHRERLRGHIAERLPALQARAARNHEVLTQVMKQRVRPHADPRTSRE
ncbi:MAG: polysaccharide pyruvyl transferase family protein [Pseudomonadota bacterium]